MNITSNSTFQTHSTESEPYYYISAYVDLSGLYTGEVDSNKPYIVYFNQDNNYDYLNIERYHSPDEYGGFYLLDDQSVIGDVTVYTSPDLVYTGVLSTLQFHIGGAYKPSVALDPSPVDAIHRHSIDIWGGPSGNTPGPILSSQLERAQICHYGREPQVPTTVVHEPEWGTRKFLALQYSINLDQPRLARSREHRERWIRKLTQQRVLRSQFIPKSRVVEDEFIDGRIYVVLKVYPKFQN